MPFNYLHNRKVYGYNDLINYIVYTGQISKLNKRGPNLYVTDVMIDFWDITPSTFKHTKWLDEIKYFVKESDKFTTEKWWKNDDELLKEYIKLFDRIDIVIDNLKRWSRNTVLCNVYTCISFIGFYRIDNSIGMTVVQRSADVNLGLKYDWLQMNWLWEYVCDKLQCKKYRLNYFVLNAHIYLNNIDNRKLVKN